MALAALVAAAGMTLTGSGPVEAADRSMAPAGLPDHLMLPGTTAMAAGLPSVSTPPVSSSASAAPASAVSAPAPASAAPASAVSAPAPASAAAAPAVSVADVAAATPVLRRGNRGEAVRSLQGRLTELGYWLGGADGSFGLLTHQAVVALQKAAGLERDGIVGPRTWAALNSGTRPSAQGEGSLIEIDKTRQLLLVVRDGNVIRVLNTSTGTEQPYEEDGVSGVADTPPGTWQVSWAFDGTRQASLGELYRPRYFHQDGIAVHGSDHVPAYPASHGCVRVTDAAMDMIWREDLMSIGSTVLVREN